MGNTLNMANFLEQLSEYKPVDTCKSLSRDEVKLGFIQGLQHILNGGEIIDLFEEVDLCLEAEQNDMAEGFIHALHHIKRYIENTTQGLYIFDMLGDEVGNEFLRKLYETINNEINETDNE